jgi:phosphatidylserine/phosphatidylglycerophosphate/cardiolipin synthase-like enzyme
MVSLGDVLVGVDKRVGAAVESAVRVRHRRRLARLGWERALDGGPGGWSEGEPPPRAGNIVDLLVDGAEAVPAIAAAISQARFHVHLAGWHFAPDFPFERTQTLRELLAATAERVDVRVLAWAGSPLPLFTPDRGHVRRAREALAGGTRVRCELDDRERPFHCHHEKLVVVDDRIAFVGGIDLTTLGGDRFDTSRHPARGSRGWHDAALRLEGPIVADVAEHFRERWESAAGEPLSPPEVPASAGDVEAQLVRTVPECLYSPVPRGDFRVLEAYVRALRAAERFVYLESQFLWSPELVAVLAAKLRDPPQDDFRLVVLLPAKPNNGEDDTRGQLAVLVDADDGAGRFLPCTLYQVGSRWTPVYVHAKVGIVDDEWLTVGSANLNEHSLFNDTEVNVASWDSGLARAARLRLWSEHLECDVAQLAGDVASIIDERWRPIAEEQHDRRLRRDPPTHRLCLLPHLSWRAKRLWGPLNGLLVDG